MATLLDYCSLVRSKNAGPFTLTFDFMCRDEQRYRALLGLDLLTAEFMAARYGCDREQVKVVAHDGALAIKISMPRPTAQGDLGERDNYAGQAYAPLMDLELPDLG